jgi:hypothetical protein
MAHHVKHQAIKGTEAARHLERVDHFDRSGNVQGDGLGAGLPELDVETQPFGPMPRKFDEALGLEPSFKDETRAFMGHRRSVGLACRRSDRTGTGVGSDAEKSVVTRTFLHRNRSIDGERAPDARLGKSSVLVLGIRKTARQVLRFAHPERQLMRSIRNRARLRELFDSCHLGTIVASKWSGIEVISLAPAQSERPRT